MKIRVLITLLIGVLISIPISAQEIPIKKGKLGIGFGFNCLGPVFQMNNLMKEYNFDKTTHNILDGSPIRHPSYMVAGFTGQISYSYYLNSRIDVGVIANRSYLRTIMGLHTRDGGLEIKFINYSLTPIFRFKINSTSEFQLGPALMLNSGKKIRGYKTKEEYTKVSGGMLLGISIKKDNLNSFSKISINYYLTYNNEMGPFTAGDDYSTTTIPESEVNFGYLSIVYIWGFRL